MDSPPKTILVSAYLRGDEHRAKLRYFENLDQLLRPLGYRLLLLNLVPGPLPPTSCACVSAYSFIVGPRRAPGSSVVRKLHLPDEIRAAASVEAGVQNWSAAEAQTKLLYFRAFARRIIKKYSPALCVLWHQFNGHHMALADICSTQNIPVVFAEYGVLPGTIVFETGGQMALSWVAQEIEKFTQLPVFENELETARQYLDIVKKERRTRKPQSSAAKVADICARQRKKGKKIVFYAGEHGFHSGMLPRDLPDAIVHSPHFEDTADAIGTLNELAASNQWHILFKPHPLDKEIPFVRTGHAEHLTVAEDADVFQCIEHADLTATILSQVSYLSMIHDRPCLLLGRNPLSGKGAAYEITSRDETEAVVKRALDAGFTPEQKTAWLRHVARILKYYVFSFDEDIGRIATRGPEDAAQYLIAQTPSQTTERTLHNNAAGIFGGDLQQPVARFILTTLYTGLRFAEPVLRYVLRIP